MANLELDMSKTAVLAMDYQKTILAMNSAVEERRVVEKAQAVIEGSRRVGIPVIHVVIQFREGYPEVSSRNKMSSMLKQTGRLIIGHEGTAIHDELAPSEGDLVVARPRANAFYNSELQSILSAKRIDTLVLMGVATNWVVEATARHAADADYRLIVLQDCCAGITAEAHEFSITNILGAIAEVMTSEEFLTNLKQRNR